MRQVLCAAAWILSMALIAGAAGCTDFDAGAAGDPFTTFATDALRQLLAALLL